VVRGRTRTSEAVSFQDSKEQALKGVGEHVWAWAAEKE
jgi:hypothetical protein